MQNQSILTPYFLDQRLSGLEVLAGDNWILNIPGLPAGEPQVRMGVLHETLATEVAQALNAGKRPVSIVGDCCAAIGVAAGIQRAGIEADLIWFDAHGDFNTWDTTPSGFLGGMPLAMIAGLGEMTMPHHVGLQPWPLHRITLTDARDLDPGERDLIASSGIKHLSNPAKLLEVTLDRNLYVHFDTDILSPEDAPAMNYLASGGPRASELAAIFRVLAATGQIAAVSMSTWNPDLDEDGRSQAVCMELLNILLGL